MTLHITRAPLCCHEAVAFLAAEPREDWEQVKFPHGSAAIAPAAAESTRPHITYPVIYAHTLGDGTSCKQLSLVIDHDSVSGCWFLK